MLPASQASTAGELNLLAVAVLRRAGLLRTTLDRKVGYEDESARAIMGLAAEGEHYFTTNYDDPRSSVDVAGYRSGRLHIQRFPEGAEMEHDIRAVCRPGCLVRDAACVCCCRRRGCSCCTSAAPVLAFGTCTRVMMSVRTASFKRHVIAMRMHHHAIQHRALATIHFAPGLVTMLAKASNKHMRMFQRPKE